MQTMFGAVPALSWNVPRVNLVGGTETQKRNFRRVPFSLKLRFLFRNQSLVLQTCNVRGWLLVQRTARRKL
ncbi:hypothetical protein MRX96_001183 [Rhipicephalus microplus]